MSNADALMVLSHVGLWILGITLSVLAYEILKRTSELQLQIAMGHASAGLPAAALAPQWKYSDLRTGLSVSDDFAAGSTHWLLFVSIECSTCRSILLGLDQVPDEWHSRIVLVCLSASAVCTAMCASLPPAFRVVVDADGAMRRDHRVIGAPALLSVDGTGRLIATGHPSSSASLVAALRSSAEEASSPSRGVRNA